MGVHSSKPASFWGNAHSTAPPRAALPGQGAGMYGGGTGVQHVAHVVHGLLLLQAEEANQKACLNLHAVLMKHLMTKVGLL